MTLASAIARFLQHLSAERNLAPSTVAAYGYDLERFAAWLAENGGPRALRQIEALDLKVYLAMLKDEHGLKPTSLSRVVSSLRVFFKWAEEQEYRVPDPARGLRTPRKGRKLPVYLTPGESRRVLKYFDLESPNGARDYAVVTLLVMCGLRLAELVGLDLQDVDRHSGTLKVLGKGRKERLAPLNATAAAALDRWLAIRPPCPHSPAVFLSSKGDERISRRTVQYVVKKLAKALGLDPRLSPHKLRHTFATTLYGEDVDLRDIQELLGHSNIASTSIYTHTNVSRIRDAVGKLEGLGGGGEQGEA